jgi:transcriptional regulator with XRE-family HTH domain
MTLTQQDRDWAFFVTGKDNRGKPRKRLTHAEVAEKLGVSRQRVGQIIAEVKAEREPEVAELLQPWETDKEFLALGQEPQEMVVTVLDNFVDRNVVTERRYPKASKPRKASPLTQYFGLPKDERRARRNALKAKHGIGEHEKNPATGNGWTMKELLAL